MLYLPIISIILSQIISVSVLGWLYDATHSYMWPFAVTGGSIAISGVMLYFIPLLSRLQHRRRTRDEVNMGVRIGVNDKKEESKEAFATNKESGVEINGNRRRGV